MILHDFAIVVVAQHHNPTILNPDFLARNEIVPDDWGWERDEDCFSTPPLAKVKYNNGVSLVCQASKLQFIDAGQANLPDRSKIPRIALKYLETLPHVDYTGLGINFNAVIEHDTPGPELIDQFLKPGPWNEAAFPLEELGLRLTYHVDNAKLRVSLDSGAYTPFDEPEGSKAAILAGANFHHDLNAAPPVEQVGEILEKRSHYWEQFKTLLAQIIESSRSPSG